jgi:formate hydrogenlyase subunit 5
MTTPAVMNPNAFDALVVALKERFGTAVSQVAGGSRAGAWFEVHQAQVLPSLTKFLFSEVRYAFGGLIVEERQEWNLRYVFLAPGSGWMHFVLRLPLTTTTIPSISAEVHAADWYEREAEDLFGLDFEQHPRLGDFILHDQVWHEAIAPMRKSFDATRVDMQKRPREDWRPVLVVKDPGAFAMPVGPVYEGGMGESVHFLLETVGEDVIRAVPRLFFNFRAIEKIAEGRHYNDALLLAERFSAKSAVAHSLAFCHAIENTLNIEVPKRAGALRVLLCELERLRHHAGSIAALCQSTGLSVSQAHASMIEEQLLRASCVFAGHRYLFGLNTPGGLRRDFDSHACRNLWTSVEGASEELQALEERLRFSSSFLDRLEDVGIVSPDHARDLGLVGPVGRASGVGHDLRRDCPYSDYQQYRFAVPCEQEGDGYARLRILFAEARESAALIKQVIQSLEPGAVCATFAGVAAESAAAGWVEAPIGTALHWVALDARGRIQRYRVLSPSFRNWLGLHVAVEEFAFQDFPIILASFALSASECDR